MIIWDTSLDRTAGRVLVFQGNYSTAGNIRLGWNSDGLLATTALDGIKWQGTSIKNRFGAADGVVVAVVAQDVDYRFAFSLKATGGYIFIKGGAFADWSLLWVAPLGSGDPVYPAIANYDQVMTSDYSRGPDALWLPEPLAYDAFGRANGVLGDSESHGPDGQYIWAAPAWQEADYITRVVNTAPIAYWPLDEASGTTAVEQMDSPNQDGTYARDVSTMGTATGIGDGNTAPSFDGTQDFVDIYSATLDGVFDGEEVTVAGWFKVANVGVWTDGDAGDIVLLLADSNNMVRMLKHDNNDQFSSNYKADAVSKWHSITPYSETGWVHFAMTASLSAGATGEKLLYLDGVKQGATLDNLGTWAGSLSSNNTVIGAYNISAANPFPGQIAHVAVWDRALEADEIASLAGVKTWAIASNEATNTPTLGAELVTDPGLEGNYTAGLNDNLTSGGAPNVAQSATVHGGTKAQQFQGTAGSDRIRQSENIVLGIWYQASIWAIRTAGARGQTQGGIYNGAAYLYWDWYNNAVYTEELTIFRALATAAVELRLAATWGAGPYDTVVVDDFSLKALTLNTLFSSIETSTADVVAQIELDTVVSETQAGIVLNLDDKDNPQNFVVAHLNRADNTCKLEKCVAGVYTSVISAAAAYSAGKSLVVVKDGTSYSLYYNDAQVGATQTVSDAGIVDNTLHGMFSTYDGNQLDNFQVFARGTGGEYDADLDRYAVLAHRPVLPYKQKVINTAPIAYWPLDEVTGTDANCEIDSNQDGTFARDVSVMGTTMGPDGMTAPMFNGTDDYVNCKSATFDSAFDGEEGSVFIWAKVDNLGVWTDAAWRRMFSLDANTAAEYVRLTRHSTNNRLSRYYRAGGVTETDHQEGLSLVNWMHVGITWSLSAGVDGEVRYWLNGAEIGTVDTTLGTWVGPVDATFPLIGASTQAPAQVWYGGLSHCAVWDRPLSATEIEDLADCQLVTPDTYQQKTLKYSPVAYWPLDEVSGTNANCLVNAAQDGTFARDVSAMGTTMGPDGETAPVFNGAGDYINIDTAALEAAFDGDEGSWMIWVQPVESAQWNDTNLRRPFTIYGNNGTDDQLYFQADGGGNMLQVRRGSGVDRNDSIAVSGAGWVHFTGRWSRTNNETEIFKDGVGTGSPAICDQNWSSATFARALIGAWAASSLPWAGGIAHVALFDRVLSDTEIEELSTV
jgi:hypothetical protein